MTLRRIAVALLAVLPLATGGCSRDAPAPRSRPSPAADADVDVDPSLLCVRDHPAPPRWRPVIRAMCSELHGLGGISVAVAIAEDDAVIWSTAIGPRCLGHPELLSPTTTMRMGSITKLVTAAVAVHLAERRDLSLDEPLPSLLPGPEPTLRSLLQHTSGLRDPEGMELLTAGEHWPAVLAKHRVAPGSYHYANANYLLVGRVIERLAGRPLPEIIEDQDQAELAPLSAVLGFDPARIDDPGCGHAVWLFGWSPIPLRAEPPLPAYTRPAGGGLASVEQLARLPAALVRTGALPTMTAAPVPTETPSTRYGLGVRMATVDGEPALAHAGQTAAHWAELQWSRAGTIAVAVVSSTPQPFRATTLAAFEAARPPEPAER